MKTILDKIKIPSSLKDYVAYVYTNFSSKTTPEIEIPDGLPEILFLLEGGFKKRALSSKQTPFVINKSSLIGLQEDIFMTTHGDTLKCIGVKFTPIGFYALFGNLSATVTNKHIFISELNDGVISALNNEILICKTTSEAISILEKFFKNLLPKFKENNITALLSNCIEQIKASKGMIHKSQLAEKFNINSNELETHFQNYLGLSVEKLIAILKLATENKIEPVGQHTVNSFSISDLIEDVLNQ